MTPQWDTSLQASNFLPDQFNPANAANLYARSASAPIPAPAPPGAAWTRGSSGQSRRRSPTPSRALHRAPHPRLGNRFNGSFQAGQGINDQLQDGGAFRVSPRFGFVYDISGKGETIVRGGAGVFYDRPQGNMVFDMITNAPGILESTICSGAGSRTRRGGRAAIPTRPRVEPIGLRLQAAEDLRVEPGRPAQAVERDHLRHRLRRVLDRRTCCGRSRSTRCPTAPSSCPQNQDPTRAPSTTPGATALPDDLLRPYPGYGNIRMWKYDGYSNYHALQTSINRRFDNGFMFSAFYVWSKALTINNNDDQSGVPNVSEEEIRRADYSYADFDRPHNFVVNFIYQTPKVASGAARRAGERLADLGHLPLGRAAGRTRSTSRSPASGPRTSPARRQPERPRRGDVRPGQGLERRSLPADRHVVLRPAAARQRRHRVGSLLPARPADQQPGPLGLQGLPGRQAGRLEVRARRVQRAQPHPVQRRQQHGRTSRA